MSKYTTGEIAKLCGITVRTVQYYDKRGILVPAELTEGGRRLYSDEDFQKLKIICFLRSLDFSIDNISVLFNEENPDKVISLLIEQQEEALNQELKKCQEKLSSLSELKTQLKKFDVFSVNSIGDIVHIMENKKKLRRLYGIMITVGILMDIAEIVSFITGIVYGIWLPFIISCAAILIFGVLISKCYYERVAYICPECHRIFRSSFREMFFAAHTPSTRRLTCPHCHKKSFCVETYNEGVKSDD